MPGDAELQVRCKIVKFMLVTPLSKVDKTKTLLAV